ncbi:MAG: pantoate--beta-alanine ligase [Chrysiogenales bacterium]|nr:MAG: pantoate--beta-alanine ligase [Chrysiogenales bacterium]
MEIITSVAEMQQRATAARDAGKTVSFVPTMGFLHQGHASLLREGRAQGDLLVLSIFVNPTQFGVGEDFESYPRDLQQDSEIAAQNGVDIIFSPTAGEMYPQGYQTYINVETVSLPLCGASRPGHFRGVTTVVAKLFNIVKPTQAFFGEKDFQQLTVIRRMVLDLNMDVKIVGMPTVREDDGLAKSSRNTYLLPDERIAALCLSRSLAAVSDLYRRGETNVLRLREELLKILNSESLARIDYAEFRDGDSLEEVGQADDRTVVALAVRIGTTRLIDNTMIGRGVTWKERC